MPDASRWLVERRRSDTDFLERVWPIAFGRPVDDEGRQLFLYRLSCGNSRLVILEELMSSLEYSLHEHSDDTFCRHLYRLILSRDPDPSDTMTGWLDLLRQKGRRATFEAFCTAEEVQLRCAAEDSYDLVRGQAGYLMVTFRRFEVHITFGQERAPHPLIVNTANGASITAMLRDAGFEGLAVRLAKHIEEPVQASWQS